MPLAIPPELKPITAYIRRAEELDADKSDPSHRIVAYHCRSYAMEKAMNLSSGTESVNSFLMTLMQDLENCKATISMSKEEAKALCEAHAVGIFHGADDDDRGDSENYREIARCFYNSSSFFDILEQFGPLDEEMNSKRTYSKWKATEIMKALKEGRTPTPGGYGGDEAPPRPDSTGSDSGISSGIGGIALPPSPSGGIVDMGLPSPPGASGSGGFQMPQQPQYNQPPPQQQYQQPPQQQYQQPPQQQYQQPPQQQYQQPPQQQYQQPPQQQYQQPPQQQYQQPPQQQYQSQAPTPSLQPPSHQPVANYKPPPKTTNLQSNISDAIELCAFAMAALKHDDTKLGAQRLRDALNLLS